MNSTELYKAYVDCEALLQSVQEIDYDDDVSFYSSILKENLEDFERNYQELCVSLKKLQSALIVNMILYKG